MPSNAQQQHDDQLQRNDQHDELIVTMKELIDTLPPHQAALKRAWRATIVALVLAATSLTLTVSNVVSIVQINSLKDHTRAAICEDHNVTAESIRAVLKVGLLALAPDSDNLTPDQQFRVDRFGDVVDSIITLRDCSPEALNAYYNRPRNPEGTLDE